jgi:ABC-2 type transport system ATP-binding protein
MTYSLELRDVRKSYGDFAAVKGVSLQVPPGMICGLLGPNGAGKTTSIRMIMDIIAPDSGEVHFFGRLRQPADLKRVGYLPEERGLYKRMAVADHLAFLGELRGLKRGEALARGRRWLERMDLVAWEKKKVEELSKGMQQKLQLAGTVLHEPDIIILDEPFSGLDPINQELFKQAFADFKAEGKAILFSTHVMEQAEKLCDEICLISHGRAVLQGGLREMKRRMGGNSYRLVAEGDLERAARVAGVEQVLARDGWAKLLLHPEARGPEVLRRLVEFLEVREFRSEEPDLEEIFIKAVREAEAGNADDAR